MIRFERELTLNLTHRNPWLDRFTASVIRKNDLKHVKLRDWIYEKVPPPKNYGALTFAKISIQKDADVLLRIFRKNNQKDIMYNFLQLLFIIVTKPDRSQLFSDDWFTLIWNSNFKYKFIFREGILALQYAELEYEIFNGEFCKPLGILVFANPK